MGAIAKILLADDDQQMQIAITASLERAGYQLTVVGNGVAALAQLETDTFDLIITDQKMPEMGGSELLAVLKEREAVPPVIMITAYGTINQAVEAMQQGAADFLPKPFSAEELVRVVERVLSAEAKAFRQESKKTKTGRPIVTADPLMIRVLEVAEAVARSDATVLIQGESGTGKELVARLIHTASTRVNQPFVAVNCAALPAALLESELFGHEKGAFTGAHMKKVGKFELAQGGTILLDEISEMELPLQAKLLRVLQEREVDRVGGREPISIDVRVVATTNRQLQDMVDQGKFRADLYYRLNVIPITLPSLRERRSDIRLLVEHFMRQNLGASVPALTEDVLEVLCSYSWPGNVRELQNAVERAAILSQGNAPRAQDFLIGNSPAPQPVQNRQPLPARVEKSVEQSSINDHDLVLRSGTTVEEMERRLIMETLKSTGQNRTQAAKLLGISIRTLRNKLNEYRGAGFDVGDEPASAFAEG